MAATRPKAKRAHKPRPRARPPTIDLEGDRYRQALRAPLLPSELAEIRAAPRPAVEPLWWCNRQKIWVECPVLKADEVFLYIEFSGRPIRIVRKWLAQNGMTVGGVPFLGEFFMTAARKAQLQYLDAFDLFGGRAVDPAAASFGALGLAFGSSREEVQAAYRRLVKIAHPDQGGTAEAFRKLNAHYQVALRKAR